VKIIQIQQYIGITEVFNVEIISSEIIKAIIANDDITLRTDEGFSFEENGLFNILDNLCTYWNYDKSRITIETNNWQEAHSHYNIKSAEYSIDFLPFSKMHTPKTWNQEKTYGMFIGRGTAERIYSIIKNKKFKYKDQGLTSFHHNFDTHPINQMLALASMHTNCPVNDILSIVPYSDIDYIRTPPIIGSKLNSTHPLWTTAYEKIALEIVCETNLWPTSFQVTEKTLRPIYYQRPFIVLGSKDYLKKLKNLGFRTFNNIIPSYYDGYERFIRVDNIFKILEGLIEQKRINLILDECHSDIVHNYNLLLELSNRHRQTRSRIQSYYDN
jgi:hypothetical protein